MIEQYHETLKSMFDLLSAKIWFGSITKHSIAYKETIKDAKSDICLQFVKHCMCVPVKDDHLVKMCH